jgi:hypothetical protein
MRVMPKPFHRAVVGWVGASGAVMGFASVFGLTRGIEAWLWLGIAVVTAFLIAWFVPRRRFLHGFLGGALSGILAPVVQAAMFRTYLAHDPDLAASVASLPGDVDPRLFFLATAPVIGVLSGLVLGILSWIAGRLVGPSELPPPAP